MGFEQVTGGLDKVSRERGTNTGLNTGTNTGLNTGAHGSGAHGSGAERNGANMERSGAHKRELSEYVGSYPRAEPSPCKKAKKTERKF